MSFALTIAACNGSFDISGMAGQLNAVRAWPAGDCNGDGREDYARFTGLGEMNHPGHLTILDGRDGSVLRDQSMDWYMKRSPKVIARFAGADRATFFSAWLSGDGGRDVVFRSSCSGIEESGLAALVTSAAPGDFVLAADERAGSLRWIALGHEDEPARGMSVKIVDMRTGLGRVERSFALDRTFHYGAFGHFTGTEALDLCLSNPWTKDGLKNAGVVCLLDGEDGALTVLEAGTLPEEGLGVPVANMGDVDHDGYDEILVGRRIGPNVPNDRGQLDLVSMLDGHRVWSLAGKSGSSALDRNCHVLDDFDGDGVLDLAHTDLEPGHVALVSGATGVVLRNVRLQDEKKPARECWVASCASCADADGDGTRDVLISFRVAPAGEFPQESGVAVASSRDGRILIQVQSPK